MPKRIRVELTPVERDHILTVMRDAEEDGIYYGNQKVYLKRQERIKAKLTPAEPSR